MPAYTWMATAAAPVMVGAVPVLVDIDESLTIDPADIERKITPYTRAIMPVHMLNLPCNMDAIMAIAKKRKLLVIEDACQAVGVRYKDRYCGAIGDAGAFSFNAYKNINIGEGGAVITNDDRIFARARKYHDLGSAGAQPRARRSTSRPSSASTCAPARSTHLRKLAPSQVIAATSRSPRHSRAPVVRRIRAQSTDDRGT